MSLLSSLPGNTIIFPRLVDLNSRDFLAGGQLDRTHGAHQSYEKGTSLVAFLKLHDPSTVTLPGRPNLSSIGFTPRTICG